ncbi:MAG: ribosome maturation factor RimP [Eubacteriales bacterium]|nr:ribosome maturation factor RimP [Eubacteriales bacterium]
MAKAKEIRKFVSDVLADFLRERGLELYHVEFSRSGKDWNLEVTIDKVQEDPDGGEQYIGSDDCETVSRYLSDRLDDTDLIQQNYLLTVSSPGLDRQLYEPKDYKRFTGRTVDVRLYQQIDGHKEISGELMGLENGILRVREENGKIWEIPESQVSKTCLAVVF